MCAARNQSLAPLAPSIVAIAGLDPTGGAGLLADAGVIRAAGLHVRGVATAATIQGGTQRAQLGAPIPPKIIAAQLARLIQRPEEAAALVAVKIGLVPSAGAAAAIGAWLRSVPTLPVVWDPVLGASAGGRLLQGTALTTTRQVVRTLAGALAATRGGATSKAKASNAKAPKRRASLTQAPARVAVMTPNVKEAHVIAKALGLAVPRGASHAWLAPRLADALGISVLIKGGHAPADGKLFDALVVDKELYVIEKDYVPGGTEVRGTGCALSSLIASGLAHGVDVVSACCDASHALTDSLGDADVGGEEASKQTVSGAAG